MSNTPDYNLPFPLPDGHALLPIGTPMVIHPTRGYIPRDLLDPKEKDTLPDAKPYGGATIGGGVCANGAELMSMDARTYADNDFRFHVYEFLNGVTRDIPLQRRCTGRGNLYDNHFANVVMWAAWEGDTFWRNVVPESSLPAVGGAAPVVGFKTFEQGYIRVLAEQHGFVGDRLINLAALGVPPASGYVVEIAVDGPAADLVLMVGRSTADPNFKSAATIEAVTVAPLKRVKECGTVAANADGTLLVSAPTRVDHAFVDILMYL